MSLIEHLQQIPEFRAARGQRHELWLVLLLIILGAMIGYWGYRPLAGLFHCQCRKARLSGVVTRLQLL
ncbi:MAG: transposase family protein [Myxacorys chilensis ATA2-1-KO14]|nr:transposase family protein [Myxacorys chilensis ATA2-1-KO14]